MVCLCLLHVLIASFASSPSLLAFLLARLSDVRLALGPPRRCGSAALPPLVVVESSHSFRIVQQPTCADDPPPTCVGLADGLLLHKLAVSHSHVIASYLFAVSSEQRDAPIECATVGGARRRFRLPPMRGDVSFLIYSDAQWDMDMFRRLLSLGAHRLAAPAAIVYGGDATQHAQPMQWARFISAVDEQGSFAPLVLARGNHDSPAVSPFNRAVFGAARDAHVTSVSVGGAHLVVVDADWVLRQLAFVAPTDSASVAFFAELDAALASPAWRAAPFRIVVCHVPTVIEWWEPVAWFVRNEQREPSDIARLLWPRWRDAGVDVIVGGHSHMYSHRVLEPHGVHEFIVGGAGGALERLRVANASTALFERLVHHYVAVEVRGCTLHWEARDAADEPLETLALASRRCVPTT